MHDEKQQLENIEEEINRVYALYHQTLSTSENKALLVKQHYEALTNKRNRLENLGLARAFDGEKSFFEFLDEIVQPNSISRHWLKSQEDTVLMISLMAATKLFRDVASEMQERYGKDFF